MGNFSHIIICYLKLKQIKNKTKRFPTILGSIDKYHVTMSNVTKCKNVTK